MDPIKEARRAVRGELLWSNFLGRVRRQQSRGRVGKEKGGEKKKGSQTRGGVAGSVVVQDR